MQWNSQNWLIAITLPNEEQEGDMSYDYDLAMPSLFSTFEYISKNWSKSLRSALSKLCTYTRADKSKLK